MSELNYNCCNTEIEINREIFHVGEDTHLKNSDLKLLHSFVRYLLYCHSTVILPFTKKQQQKINYSS